jgi:hypothetical protein
MLNLTEQQIFEEQEHFLHFAWMEAEAQMHNWLNNKRCAIFEGISVADYVKKFTHIHSNQISNFAAGDRYYIIQIYAWPGQETAIFSEIDGEFDKELVISNHAFNRFINTSQHKSMQFYKDPTTISGSTVVDVFYYNDEATRDKILLQLKLMLQGQGWNTR